MQGWRFILCSQVVDPAFGPARVLHGLLKKPAQVLHGPCGIRGFVIAGKTCTLSACKAGPFQWVMRLPNVFNGLRGPISLAQSDETRGRGPRKTLHGVFARGPIINYRGGGIINHGGRKLITGGFSGWAREDGTGARAGVAAGVGVVKRARWAGWTRTNIYGTKARRPTIRRQPIGGRGGIRTHGRGSPSTCFRDRRDNPLRHPAAAHDRGRAPERQLDSRRRSPYPHGHGRGPVPAHSRRGRPREPGPTGNKRGGSKSLRPAGDRRG